jgi:hypothetical protein
MYLKRQLLILCGFMRGTDAGLLSQRRVALREKHGKDDAKAALAHVVLSVSEVRYEHTQKGSLLSSVDNCGQYHRATSLVLQSTAAWACSG